MCYMFFDAIRFNQPIGNWDVSNVKYMDGMFEEAESFNQDLSKWDLTGKGTMNIFDNCPIEEIDEYKPKM